MTEQEIIDLVDKYTGICDIIFSEELADALIPIIEQEKKDTLKEFVEWLKNKLDKQLDEQEKKTQEDNTEFFGGGLEGRFAHETYNAYEEGVFNGIFSIQDGLEAELKCFVEEREK